LVLLALLITAMSLRAHGNGDQGEKAWSFRAQIWLFFGAFWLGWATLWLLSLAVWLSAT